MRDVQFYNSPQAYAQKPIEHFHRPNEASIEELLFTTSKRAKVAFCPHKFPGIERAIESDGRVRDRDGCELVIQDKLEDGEAENSS